MLRKCQILLWVLIFSLIGGVCAAQCYVMQRSGERLKGVELTADSDGTLKLRMEQGGPVQTLKPGSYLYGFVPKPAEVDALEKAHAAGKQDVVLQQAGPLFDKYKYLGWGDHISYLEGMVLVDRKQFDQAKKAFERGARYKARAEEELIRGMALALIGLKQTDLAKSMLDRMVRSENSEDAAFAFNVRGSVLAQEGKKKEAVLEYLKTLLLFKPGTAKAQRDESRKAVVALLKEMGDPRAGEFEKLP